jgi:acetoin utilization deacetylase AcuC-like enzyme
MFFYHPHYTLAFGEHVFPVRKYERVAARFPTEPAREATEDELLLVHTPAYLARLRELTKTPERGYAEFEVPVYEAVLRAFRWSTGGSIEAARRAMDTGRAANVGGGFHHAFADRGEGFCLLNDLAVLIRVLQRDGRIRRAAVVDLDLHQGNGTARIFQGDASVFTFSMHQENLYPRKERSTLDIGLDEFTADDEYLSLLGKALPQVWEWKPDLVVYQAGADPYEHDRLGQLKLTKRGLAERDAIVIGESRRRGLPIVVTLGGGYAEREEDVVEIHSATLSALRASA